MDREYLVEMCTTYLTPDEVAFELQIRNLVGKEKSLSVYRRKLKNALREEAEGLPRVFAYNRDPKLEITVCRERLERVWDNLNDDSLDQRMSKTGLLHLYNRLKLFKRTYGVTMYANDANWIFSKVIETYLSYFNENALYPSVSVEAPVSTQHELQGAASLEAQAAHRQDPINLETSEDSVPTMTTAVEITSNLNVSTAGIDFPLNLQNLTIHSTSVSVPRLSPVVSTPIVTMASVSSMQTTWSTPRYQVASRVHTSRQIRFDVLRELSDDLFDRPGFSVTNTMEQTSALNLVASNITSSANNVTSANSVCGIGYEQAITQRQPIVNPMFQQVNSVSGVNNVLEAGLPYEASQNDHLMTATSVSGNGHQRVLGVGLRNRVNQHQHQSAGTSGPGIGHQQLNRQSVFEVAVANSVNQCERLSTATSVVGGHHQQVNNQTELRVGLLNRTNQHQHQSTTTSVPGIGHQQGYRQNAFGGEVPNSVSQRVHPPTATSISGMQHPRVTRQSVYQPSVSFHPQSRVYTGNSSAVVSNATPVASQWSDSYNLPRTQPYTNDPQTYSYLYHSAGHSNVGYPNASYGTPPLDHNQDELHPLYSRYDPSFQGLSEGYPFREPSPVHEPNPLPLRLNPMPVNSSGNGLPPGNTNNPIRVQNPFQGSRGEFPPTSTNPNPLPNMRPYTPAPTPSVNPYQDMDFAPVANQTKTIPVVKWPMRYAGEDKGAGLNSFLWEVSDWTQAELIPEPELLRTFGNLLTGKAKMWFISNKHRFATYSELIYSLKATFRHPDLDHFVLLEIYQRRQQKNESFLEFFLDVERKFKSLTKPVSEEEIVQVMRRNLKPDYKRALIGREFVDLYSLQIAGQEIDATISYFFFKPQGNAQTNAIQDTGKSPGSNDQNRNSGQSGNKHFNQGNSQLSQPYRPNQGSGQGYGGRKQPPGDRPPSLKQDGEPKEESKARKLAPSRGEDQDPQAGKTGSSGLENQIRTHTPLNDKFVCFNCRSQQHLTEQCKLPYKVHCQACGFLGFPSHKCPYCSRKSQQRKNSSE